MLSNRKLEEKIAQLKALQQLQQDSGANESGNLFLDDVQIAAVKIRDQIGNLAFEIFEQIKHDLARSHEAAAYLALALDEQRIECNAYSAIDSACFNSNPDNHLSSLIINTSPNECYYEGLCYLLGIGNYKHDIHEACTFIRYAAETHHRSAQYVYALILIRHQRSDRDNKEIINWLELAANRGHRRAQQRLGIAYLNSNFGLPHDSDHAIKWLSMAARQGDINAQHALVHLSAQEKWVAVDDALKWAKSAVSIGYRYARVSLGKIYLTTEHKNINIAARWIRLAAEDGNMLAADVLSKDSNLESSYAAAMWQKDEEAAIRHVRARIQENCMHHAFLFDIHRSETNDALFTTVEKMVLALKEQGHNTTYFELAINIVKAKRAAIPFQNSENSLVSAIDTKGRRAAQMLIAACQVGMLDCVKVLLQYGINPDTTNNDIAFNRWSALKIACNAEHTDIAEILLKANANPNLFDEKDHWTALHNAAQRGSLTTVRLLLKYGADVHAASRYNRTALLIAAEEGYTSIVKTLLEHGADPTVQSNGKTALTHAANQRNMPLFLLLLQTGKFALPQALSKVNSDTNKTFKSDLFKYIKTLPINERIALCDLALDNNTPLGVVIAAEKGWFSNHEFKTLQAIKAEALAIKQKANRNEQKRNPLLEAIRLNDLELMKHWLQNGANVHGNPEDDKTPIVQAAQCGHLECMNLLIASGASFQYQDIGNTTPLHAAARAGAVECVRQLLALGADMDLLDKFDQRPLDAADECSQQTVVDLMLAHVSGVNATFNSSLVDGEAVSSNQLAQAAVIEQSPSLSASPLENPLEEDVFDHIFKFKPPTPTIEPSLDNTACLFANSNKAQPVSEEHKTKLANIASLLADTSTPIKHLNTEERTEKQLKLLENLPVPTRKITQETHVNETSSTTKKLLA